MKLKLNAKKIKRVAKRAHSCPVMVGNGYILAPNYYNRKELILSNDEGDSEIIGSYSDLIEALRHIKLLIDFVTE
jgi:hypothetical protein